MMSLFLLLFVIGTGAVSFWFVCMAVVSCFTIRVDFGKVLAYIAASLLMAFSCTQALDQLDHSDTSVVKKSSP